jgi:uncharacterized LabA/DUF88 family protein
MAIGFPTPVDPTRRYCFIDGSSLIYTLSDNHTELYGDAQLKIDWRSVLSGYDRVFFFDALPSKKKNESVEKHESRLAEKIDFHNSLSQIPGVHVREGVVKYRRKGGGQQKGVDVMLAVEALQQAMRGNVDEIVLIVSDLDFYPLLEALAQTRASTEIMYDPEKTATELIYSADYSSPVGLVQSLNWLTPPEDVDLALLKPYTPVVTQNFLDSENHLPIKIEDKKFWFFHDIKNHAYYGGIHGFVPSVASANKLIVIEQLEQNHKLPVGELRKAVAATAF